MREIDKLTDYVKTEIDKLTDYMKPVCVSNKKKKEDYLLFVITKSIRIYLSIWTRSILVPYMQSKKC
jgi:hypothetical protein